MATQNAKPIAKPVTQATTFGNPRIIKDYRFHIIVQRWLANANSIMFYLIIGSVCLSLLFLVKLGFFTTFNETYASDGTQYSCKVETVRGKK